MTKENYYLISSHYLMASKYVVFKCYKVCLKNKCCNFECCNTFVKISEISTVNYKEDLKDSSAASLWYTRITRITRITSLQERLHCKLGILVILAIP